MGFYTVCSSYYNRRKLRVLRLFRRGWRTRAIVPPSFRVIHVSELLSYSYEMLSFFFSGEGLNSIIRLRKPIGKKKKKLGMSFTSMLLPWMWTRYVQFVIFYYNILNFIEKKKLYARWWIIVKIISYFFGGKNSSYKNWRKHQLCSHKIWKFGIFYVQNKIQFFLGGASFGP